MTLTAITPKTTTASPWWRWLYAIPILLALLLVAFISIRPVQVLQAHGQRLGAEPGRWHWVTGPVARLKWIIGGGFGIYFDHRPDQRISPGSYHVRLELVGEGVPARLVFFDREIELKPGQIFPIGAGWQASSFCQGSSCLQ